MTTFISLIGSAVGVIGISFIGKQVQGEFTAWTPIAVRWLVEVAVARLPPQNQGRMGEEWCAHLDEIPGQIWKWRTAIGFWLAASKLPAAKPDKQKFLSIGSTDTIFFNERQEFDDILTRIKWRKIDLWKAGRTASVKDREDTIRDCEALTRIAKRLSTQDPLLIMMIEPLAEYLSNPDAQ